jgi:transposase-like protein
MWCSPLSNPIRTLWSRICLRPRVFFSSSKCIYAKNKRTDEFDGKILELHQQGFTVVQIAQQLPGYGFQNIVYRLRKIRAKSGSPPTSSGEKWQPSEDTVLVEKRDAGLQWENIVPSLPGRSCHAASLRYGILKRGKSDTASLSNQRKRWPPEERQRALEMMVVDRLPIRNVAKSLGRTYRAVQQMWQKHGPKALPAASVEDYRGELEWTKEQDDILIEQRKRGVPYKTIRLKLPEKSVKALFERARALRITRPQMSTVQAAAIRKDLRAVLEGTATYEEVHSKYASIVSRTSIRNCLYRVRREFYDK